MAVAAIASLKGLLRFKGKANTASTKPLATSPDDTLDPLPTVGFRASYQPKAGRFHVTVLGARHLPAKLPGLEAEGYVVKLKLFPGSSKFETSQQQESWPTYNESFTFPLACAGKNPNTALTASNFLMVSVYAVDSHRRRRVVGAISWPLDRTSFVSGQGNNLETADIWRRLQDIRSGMPAAVAQSQFKKDVSRNQLEVTLRFTPGEAEAGVPDTLFLGVNRLRWSLNSTREYAEKKAQLYVKLSVLEIGGSCIKSRNSRPFEPSISVHLTPEDDQAVLEVVLPPPGPRRDGLTCQLSLCTRPSKIAKKVVLGRTRFGTTELKTGEEKPVTSHLGRALQKPGDSLVEWHALH